MWLIWNILKVAIDIAVLPVSIVSDSLTLWWVLNDSESMVKRNLETLVDDITTIDD